MIIDRAVYTDMIEHMRQAAPAEGVGLLAGPLDRADPAGGAWSGPTGPCDRWVPLRNVSDFPRLRYEVDPAELVGAWQALEDEGRRPWGVCHSHVTSDAVPSPLDVRYATDPTLLHLVVSLAGHPAAVTAWLWRLDPNATGPDRCHRVRYQVADLGFQAVSPTDLTHRVTPPIV